MPIKIFAWQTFHSTVAFGDREEMGSPLNNRLWPVKSYDILRAALS